jgi:NAD(P)-dependent dehydrogenase (short-subunit alcohol dehydrogenase family)
MVIGAIAAQELFMPAAIITGASSGIGRCVALQLAQAGYSLALAARRIDSLERVASQIREQLRSSGTPQSRKIIIVETDVGKATDVIRLVDQSIEKLGHIDVLVNNAGFAPLIHAGEYDVETLARSFAVNAFGPAVAINHLWQHMATHGGGRIVNVSTTGTRDPFNGFFAYAASKSAMNSFARSIAKEGEDDHIKGFAVAPGAVETPMLRALFDRDMIPESQTLDPADVAKLIVECATGARDQQNGETIFIER